MQGAGAKRIVGPRLFETARMSQAILTRWATPPSRRERYRRDPDQVIFPAGNGSNRTSVLDPV